MMKKTVIIAILAAVMLTAKAQERVGTWSVIPKIGLSFAKMTDNTIYVGLLDGASNLTNSPKYKPGLMAGVDIDYQLLDKASITLGAIYSQQGCKYKDMNVLDFQDTKTAVYTQYKNVEYRLQYINIPLTFNYYVFRNFAVKAGVQLDIPIAAKMGLKYVDMTIDKTTNTRTYGTEEELDADIQPMYKKVGCSIPVGISYEYENVILDLRYNIGLTEMAKSEYGGGSRNQVFALTVGYKIPLND